MSKKKVKKQSNKLGILGIIGVVAIMGIVLFSGINSKKDELAGLKEEESVLEDKYEKELLRAEKLEEQRVYVKTKKYVEEVAKQLGLVYPNEVIYKPSNK